MGLDLFPGGLEPSRLLAVDDVGSRLYGRDLDAACAAISRAMGRERALVFLLCQNDPGTLLGYLGCLRCGAVPLALSSHIAPALLRELAETYHPGFYCIPKDLPAETRAVLPNTAPLLELRGSVMIPGGGAERYPIHPELALLLTTSGSTGSPKLVRLSGRNLASNAASIVQYLGLDADERPITTLPLNYSYGMSIVNSHMLVGAPVLLTAHGVLERGFWNMVRRERATSLAGVPYTYQMFHRLGLTTMELPRLRYLTQAGGKLPPELQGEFAAWVAGTGRRFYVMYGQTEAAPRMSYLPPERAIEKIGSIGIPIPGGRFRLEDTAGVEIASPDTTGELIYCGENVAMGYARAVADLAKGDEWRGRLATGDMARRDRDGFYYIVGRKKRFVKLYGNRVNMDEVERLLSARFSGAGFACTGRDDLLCIYTDSRDPTIPEAAQHYISEETRLSPRAFRVQVIDTIPKNESGKTLYSALLVE